METGGTRSDDADHLFFPGFYWEPEPVREAAGVIFPLVAVPLAGAEEDLAVASEVVAAEVLAAAALPVAGNAGIRWSVIGIQYF